MALYPRAFTPLHAPPASLSVIQFNMLAQSLTSPDDFYRSPPDALAWERRKHALLDELTRHTVWGRP